MALPGQGHIEVGHKAYGSHRMDTKDRLQERYPARQHKIRLPLLVLPLRKGLLLMMRHP